ncbi:MAG: flagellar basal body protein, partial [Pseudomonadota bacterium]
MSTFDVFEIAGSAMKAQSIRLNAVASNMANAESVSGPTGKPYRPKHVVFESAPVGAGGAGVRVKQVIEDPRPPRLVYEPHNPIADEQ